MPKYSCQAVQSSRTKTSPHTLSEGSLCSQMAEEVMKLKGSALWLVTTMPFPIFFICLAKLFDNLEFSIKKWSVYQCFGKPWIYIHRDALCFIFVVQKYSILIITDRFLCQFAGINLIKEWVFSWLLVNKLVRSKRFMQSA